MRRCFLPGSANTTVLSRTSSRISWAATARAAIFSVRRSRALQFLIPNFIFMALTFTDSNFDSEVLKSDQPVLVDFWAPWCGPCQMMGPIIDEVAEEMKGKAKVGKLDVDENPKMASEYGIMSIPSLKIFKGGKVVKEFSGVQQKGALKEVLSNV